MEYKVQFEITGKGIGGLRGRIGYAVKNKIFRKGKVNFIKIGKVYSTNTAVGGSVQDLTGADFLDTEGKTDVHEQGHFFGWFDKDDYKKHNKRRDGGYHRHEKNSDGTPSIMQNRNQLTPEEQKNRKVTQRDVDNVLDKHKKNLKTKKKFKL